MNTRRIFVIIFLMAPFMGGAVAVANPFSHSGLTNPCQEDEFLDLYSNQCKVLDKNFGFSFKEFNKNHKSLVINIKDCKESSIHNAVAKVKDNGGGTINLAACTYTITSRINLSSNTLFQGMGSDKTILKQQSGNAVKGDLLRVYGTSSNRTNNVIVRDIKIQGDKSQATNAIIAQRSGNILVERVELANFGKSGFVTTKTHGVTMRYINSHDMKYHGLGVKDCYVNDMSDDKNGNGYLDRNDCDGGRTGYWSDNYAVYSNITNGNGIYGLDFHVSLFEVAGNSMERNKYGLKLPDPSINVWVHDNYAANNKKFGISSRTELCRISTMQVENHVYYRNQIIGNGLDDRHYGLYFAAAKNIILIDNVYQNNGYNNTLSVYSSCSGNPVERLSNTISICEGDEVLDNKRVGSDKVSIISDARCDLSKVGNIFGLAGDLNGDGLLDLKDAEISEDYSGKNYSKIADLNFDGVVDARDTGLINQFINGTDTVIGTAPAPLPVKEPESGKEPLITTEITVQQLLQQIEKLQQEQIQLLVQARQLPW